MGKAILAPAAVLVIWTLIILVVLAAVRARAVPALDREKVKQLPRAGARGADLDKVLPGQASWVGHNYTHLMEQPTLFYATVMILAVAGAADTAAVRLAWAYTALRIVHSFWQVLVNKVPIRFLLFLASTGCLAALATKALLATLT